ncbi:DEAD/DEAH box helicase [Vallicoccus soli]|uniref:DEAD/DEAH box helicase n=1 Tax=Vallicoccus soli TaxID=2339232 RepID=A0A3A3YYX8_9ACTN|nr:DEAD/DEAH box helicase [Vallicoccus soli]RJK95484.1 DEAD/DEAH box helicase [Vallicoccus soli]
MSTSAASHLPPAYPARAPWGTAPRLRAWQQEALELYQRRAPRDFLAVATPGAGKTTFALRIASELVEQGVVQAVTVVAPTEHLKRQWAEAAHRVGLRIDPQFRNGQGAVSREYQGVALTYAQVAAHPVLHRRRTEARRTLVVLDEIHHAGDALSWGDAVREAFEPATRRLALTGTPFRSDVSPIPFVTYEAGPDGVRRSSADYTYGYGRALADGVVRPVIFLAYTGQMRWRTRAGDEVAASLGEPMTKDLVGQAWRTALDPHGNWIPQVLTAADRRLSEVRRHVPDAGAMVIATDHQTARAYAARLRAITGEAPTVVLSDDPQASDRIEEFATGTTRWLVAVRMVSEGVDVPRLAVGVYATSTATPLFFAQAVGRFVRARRRGETASVFLPSVPQLLGHAHGMEVERDHVLDRPRREDEDVWAPEDALVAAANRTGTTGEQEALSFEALEAEAHFDRVLFDGGEFGTQAAVGSAEEEDFLGLPGLLEPDQVTTLLQARQAEQQAARRRRGSGAPAPAPEPEPEVSTHKALALLRKELNGLVGAWHHRTGQPHGAVHAELRRSCGGPPSATATAAQLQERIALIRRWAAAGRTLA